MATNFRQNGAVVTVTAPRVLTVGEGCLINGLFGVAQTAAASAATVEIATQGVWLLPADTAGSIDAGDVVYWDNTNFECDETAAGQYAIGCAIADQDADNNVLVLLNGSGNTIATG